MLKIFLLTLLMISYTTIADEGMWEPYQMEGPQKGA